MKPSERQLNRMELRIDNGNAVVTFDGVISGSEIGGVLGDNGRLLSVVNVETNTMQIENRAMEVELLKRMEGYVGIFPHA